MTATRPSALRSLGPSSFLAAALARTTQRPSAAAPLLIHLLSCATHSDELRRQSTRQKCFGSSESTLFFFLTRRQDRVLSREGVRLLDSAIQATPMTTTKMAKPAPEMPRGAPRPWGSVTRRSHRLLQFHQRIDTSTHPLAFLGGGGGQPRPNEKSKGSLMSEP